MDEQLNLAKKKKEERDFVMSKRIGYEMDGLVCTTLCPYNKERLSSVHVGSIYCRDECKDRVAFDDKTKTVYCNYEERKEIEDKREERKDKDYKKLKKECRDLADQLVAKLSEFEKEK